MSIYDLSTTASDNTTVGGIGVQEGMAPGLVNNAIRGLGADLRRWMNDLGGAATAGGSANALTLTTSSGLSNYADGFMVSFVAAATNTGAATLSVDGVGAKAIRKNGDAALVGSEILAGAHYLAQYDASANSGSGAWLLINPSVVYGAAIAALDSLTPAADRVPYFDGTTTATLATFTSFGRSLVDDADAAAARTTLGLGSIATQAASAVDLTGGTINGTTIGGTTPAAAAITTLTLGAGAVGTPSLTTAGDANTGLYFPAADQVALVAGGTARVTAGTSGVTVTGTLAASSSIQGTYLTAIGNFPGLDLQDQNAGYTTHNLFRQFRDGDLFRYQTWSAGAGSLVSTDLSCAIAVTGITSWSWRVSGTEKLLLNSSGLTVTDTLDAGAVTIGGTALAITTKSASSGTVYTNGSDVTYAHGLGVEPDLVVLVLQHNASATDAGWTGGERVIPDGGYVIEKDGTNVVVHVSTTGFTAVNKGTNASTTLAPARWNLYVEAYA